MSYDEAVAYAEALRYLDEEAEDWSQYFAVAIGTFSGGVALTPGGQVPAAIVALGPGSIAAGASLVADREHVLLGRLRQMFADVMANGSGKGGIIVSVELDGPTYRVTVINRETGNGQTMLLPIALGSNLFGNVTRADNVWKTGKACTLYGANPDGVNFYVHDHAYCQ